MDAYKGEIFRLYIVEKGRLTDVLAVLKNDHGLDVKPKTLLTQLGEWGFTKHLKRSDVVEILRLKANRDAAGRKSVFTLRGRPVSLEQVEKHRLKVGLAPIRASTGVISPSQLTGSSKRGIACRTPPPSPYLVLDESYRIPEKLLYDVDVLIKGSFEAGSWKFNGNELLIISSHREVEEKLALHDFLGNVANGSAAANARDYDLAFECWRQASLNIDTLVRSPQYHDIIPNLIQQVNDLHRQGLTPVATSLKAHIAEASGTYGAPAAPTTKVLAGLGRLDMVAMAETEERIMSHFCKLFEQYLGSRCYNSFVMTMDTARRRLLHSPWTTFAESLPDLALMDAVFGASDRRPLDVLGLRLEILMKRGLPCEMEAEARDLIRRAEGVGNDDWQRFYNLTRGWYFLGWAQYSMLEIEKRREAVVSFENALRCDEELCKIDDFHIFVPEKAAIMKYLEELRALDIPEDMEGISTIGALTAGV